MHTTMPLNALGTVVQLRKNREIIPMPRQRFQQLWQIETATGLRREK